MDRSIGRTIRELRLSRRWSQAQLADFLNDRSGSPTLTRNDISRWENGRRNPRFWLVHLAEAFGVDIRDLASIAGHAHDHDRLAHPQSATLAFAPVDEHGGHASAMQSFRLADRHVGGGHLYATVVGYLNTSVAPRLVGGNAATDIRSELAAAAGLNEMAGWMAHDVGRHESAEAHFTRSLDLALLSGERGLYAHVWASMSHLSRHLGRHAEAVDRAERGRTSLAEHGSHPELEARLLAVQARGLAHLGRRQESLAVLRQSERALAREPSDDLSPWVSRFDEGAFASEAAHVLLQFGDFPEARRQAQRVVALRPVERARSRAFAQLALAGMLVGQGAVEQACAVAFDALHATRQLGSYLIVEQFFDLRKRLVPYLMSGPVVEFVPHLDEALRERRWLGQWRESVDGVVGATFGKADA